VFERAVLRVWFTAARRRGRFLRPVAVAGTGDEAGKLVAMLNGQPDLGYRVVAVLAPDNHQPAWADGMPIVDGRTKVAEQLRLLGAASVLIATTDVGSLATNRLTRRLIDGGIHVELSSSLIDIDADRLSVRSLGRVPVLYVEPVRRNGWPSIAKRGFDIVAAAIGIVLTAPFWIPAAIAVRFTSPGPILFTQERVGRRGRRFQVFKFRTMIDGAEDLLIDLRDSNESDGPLFKVRHDPRITPLGKLLRKTSLDELPQLLNVLRGEMSLVGPRPALPREVTQWSPELFERLRVQPGITGMWQVKGRADASFAEYQRWDLYYVDNWSLWRDLSILVRTVPVVLSGDGAY
jgi:exopolysaccharide biosynthesis polyprenyl glycosylphosphotransferase